MTAASRRTSAAAQAAARGEPCGRASRSRAANTPVHPRVGGVQSLARLLASDRPPRHAQNFWPPVILQGARRAARGLMADAKPPIDWAAIEADYRAGTMPIREMARWYSISESTIRTRAKVGKWVRTSAQASAHPARAR